MVIIDRVLTRTNPSNEGWGGFSIIELMYNSKLFPDGVTMGKAISEVSWLFIDNVMYSFTTNIYMNRKMCVFLMSSHMIELVHELVKCGSESYDYSRWWWTFKRYAFSVSNNFFVSITNKCYNLDMILKQLCSLVWECGLAPIWYYLKLTVSNLLTYSVSVCLILFNKTT